MLIALIICCVSYIVFIVLSILLAEKIGNIFTTIGIVVADCMMLYGFGSITDKEWILPTITGVANLLFGIIFCILVGNVYKKRFKFKYEHGYIRVITPKKKSTAIILAIVLGWCGAQKFYLRRNTQGALCAMFFYAWVPEIVAIIDIIRLVVMSEKEFEYNYNRLPIDNIVEQQRINDDSSEIPASNQNASYDTVSSNIHSYDEGQMTTDTLDTKVEIKDLDIMIGKVSVIGDSTDDIKIYITNTSGKKFEFSAKDNMINSFKVAGKEEYVYGEV